MNKDEVIEFLKTQISFQKTQIEGITAQNNELTSLVKELNARIASLEKMLAEQGVKLEKQARVSRILGGMVDGKKSEKQKPSLTDEEMAAKKLAQAEARKKRGNNGARRTDHPEVETEIIDVYPDGMTQEMLEKMRELGVREVTRYVMIPMSFRKITYRLHTYADKDGIYSPKTPAAAYLNSNFDPSFVAGLMELRYIHSMPVERIVKYFREHGFNLSKKTANGILSRSAEVLENIYKAIGQTVKECDLINFDETYHKVLVEAEKSGDKGVVKGYTWGALAKAYRLFYMWYNDGSRAGETLLNEFGGYKGWFQSDAYTIYRKLGSDQFPDMTRLACLQHVKRKFTDCGDDRDAKSVTVIINEFYHKEHRHTIGENGWTAEKNLTYRQEYAPPILSKLKARLEELKASYENLPKTDLSEAVNYALNEYEAICNIFKRGDTSLDNNDIERCNRYVSLSRRNSLFFGSHEGARHGSILYTIAISCRLNGIRLFDYIQDVLRRTSEWQPNTPLERYRDLLPDKWKPMEV